MRIVGLDFGDVRLGFAVSDQTGIIAMPLRVVDLRNGVSAEESVRKVCEETGAEKLVIGLPVNMNASKGPMVTKVEAFIELLSKKLTIPIEKWDERLSTSLVERMLIDADMSRAKRKGVRDKLAAQVILQGYLDMQNSGSTSSYSYE